MSDQENEHVPTPPPAPEIERRSASETIGLVALGAGIGKVVELGVQDAYGKVKNLVRPTDDAPEIILPPGTHSDDEK